MRAASPKPGLTPPFPPVQMPVAAVDGAIAVLNLSVLCTPTVTQQHRQTLGAMHSRPVTGHGPTRHAVTSSVWRRRSACAWSKVARGGPARRLLNHLTATTALEDRSAARLSTLADAA